MNKIVVMVSLICAFAVQSTAETFQKKPPPAPAQLRPAGPAARPPMPYVLKKEYEPAVQEMNSRINSALNAASAARRGIEERFGRVTELDSQMQQVQAILSSANFQIALTSDSLKITRTSMEEFRTQAEKDISDLKEMSAQTKNFMYIFFGVSVLLTILVMIMLSSRVNKVKKILQNQEAELKRALSEDMEKRNALLQKELKDEIMGVKGRIQIDVSSLRTELKSQMNKDHETVNLQLSTIMDKLGMHEAGEEKGT